VAIDLLLALGAAAGFILKGNIQAGKGFSEI